MRKQNRYRTNIRPPETHKCVKNTYKINNNQKLTSRILIDFGLQKGSILAPQNDPKTIKKTTRKNNKKMIEKRAQHRRKNPMRRQPRIPRAGPSSPLHPPLRSTSWNEVQLSAAFRYAPSRFPSSAEALSLRPVDHEPSNKSTNQIH